jgi:mono/diheme cytochrome c family protein
MSVVRVARGIVLAACVAALGSPAALADRSSDRASVPSGELAEGYKLFQTFFCADCHTMHAAGPAAYGQLAMNFNRVHVPYVVAVAVISNGLPAGFPLYPTLMPEYGKVLTAGQIRDLAAFVSRYSGGYATCAPCTAATAAS